MKKFLLTAFLLAGMTQLHAHDFVSVVEGQTLYFSVSDTVRMEAIVTYPGPAADASTIKPYTGAVEIPTSVTVGQKQYSITGVGPKAFANAPMLTSVVMPSGLKTIGDFAFEGCTGLEKVIFPGNAVTFGDGVFFRCENIAQVSLGSDWTQANLSMFRWSKKLTSLYIPAKLRRLQNMKSLKSLERIDVDGNNPYYKSSEGVLYTNDGKTLLGCPRGFKGEVKVAEGTESLLWGSLADCPEVTSLILPASLQSMSYKEFSRMKQLASITFLSMEPVKTAVCNGEQVFALQVAKPVMVIVPKQAQKAYKQQIATATGEYGEIAANAPAGTKDTELIPVVVRAEELAAAQSVKGDKKLNPSTK